MATSEDFYDDAGAQLLFRNYITKIVTRKNTLTGQFYKCAPLPACAS
jgi:hypothetical protein